MGRPRRGGQRWWHGGPVGLALRTLQRAVAPAASRGTEEAVPALSTQTR